MNVLIIEDDVLKATQIQEFIVKSLAIPDKKVKIKYSYQTGLKELIKKEYDILLLDMSIPVFEGRTTLHRSYGGRDILEELDRREIFIPTFVITQYSIFSNDQYEIQKQLTREQLNDNLRIEFPDIYIGMVFYDAAELRWKESLKQLIESYFTDKNL